MGEPLQKKARSELSNKDKMVINAIFNPHTPLAADEVLSDGLPEDMVIQDTISDDIRRTEIEAVNAAEAGDLMKSLELFNKVALENPQYASVYNNRAQLLRIQGDTEAAMKDLDMAIELSCGIGKVASQAYTQRGLLHRLNGNNEAALDDFKSAAKLGNVFAKQEVCQMNPYAALCNQMLGDVFARVMRGEADVM